MLPRFVVPALATAAVHATTPASAGSLQSPPGNGTYTIKVLKSGKCLDVVGSSTQEGTPIQQFTSARFWPAAGFGNHLPISRDS